MQSSVDSIIMQARDGTPLSITQFSPAHANNRSHTVIINSAMGVAQRYYQPLANYLMRQGFKVITFDYRGIEQSLQTTIKRAPHRLIEWGKYDVASVIDWCDKQSPHAITCIGHSVGAQLIGLADNCHRLTHIITIAGQIGYWRYWPKHGRLRMLAAMFAVIPLCAHTLGYLPGRLLNSCDLPKYVALDWAKWCRNRSYFVDEKSQQHKLRFEQYTGKVHALSFYDDLDFAPPLAVDALLDQFINAQTTHTHILRGDVNSKRIGHFGYFRPSFKTLLWSTLVDELNQLQSCQEFSHG